MCEDLIQRMKTFAPDKAEANATRITQLTVNEYSQGQGIAGHIDSDACFGPIIFILSCNSGITMTLSKRTPESEKCTLPQETKKHLWLAPRSLLILQGDARYLWSHAIATRKLDKVEGQIIPRGRRVSFTFRQALAMAPLPQKSLVNSELEIEHVSHVALNPLLSFLRQHS